MAPLVERVDRLEETLNRFIEQTSHMMAANREDIAEMRASNARTDRLLLEMRQEAERDREQANRERREAELGRQQAEKERQRAEGERQLQAVRDREEADKEHQRAEKERKEFNRQLAGISDRLGSLIEDMVAPNAPRIARSLFGGDDVLTSSIRVRRRHPSDSGQTIELDLLVAGGSHVLVGEAKSKVTVDKAVAFLEKVRAVPEFFPEFKGFTILPMIASVNIEPSLVAHLSRLRIYALGFGDETMEILNGGDF